MQVQEELDLESLFGGIGSDKASKGVLPSYLEAHEPPEARGIERDKVRLLVTYRSDDRIVHTRFDDLGRFMSAGDVLVINTSGTLKAALTASGIRGKQFEVHLSTKLIPGR